ncbi:MAG: uroporphyrinogen decarboxylase family protein [Candidatus Bathyarchaeia archaeon]
MVSQEFAQINRERMLRAIDHEESDRPPVALMVNAPFFSSYANIPVKEYYTDPRKMLRAQLTVRERFYNLTPIWADGGVAVEPSALGGEIYWDTAGNPQVKPFIKDLEDIDRLETPDPSSDGWMPKQLETYRYMIENVGKDVKVDFGYLVIGPTTIAGMIRGMSKFFIDLFKHPEAARKLLRVCTDTAKVWVRAQEEVVGETDYGVFIADDAASFLTPKQFEDFIAPLYREIYEVFPNCRRWYHNDMKSTHILKQLADSGVEVFHIAYDVDLPAAKEIVGERICFVGNIPPLEVLKEGNLHTVREACATLIRNMAEGGGFILSTGGFINAGTPAENIDAMIESVESP